MTESTHPIRPTTPPYPAASTDASTAVFELPAETFALPALFERLSDVRVELDPSIATPHDYALVVVRTDVQERAVDDALRSDPGVATVERFTVHADGWTYRVTWEGRPHRLIQQFAAEDILLLSARGWSGQWRLRVLASDREGVVTADEIMDNFDCRAECLSISTFSGEGSNRPVLTDKQRETLVAAFEAGYYSIPKDVSSDDLAAKLDISHQALSERLRRAYERLIDTTLIPDGDWKD